MTVDAQRLGSGQLRGVRVDVSPAGLDTTHAGVGKAWDGFLEEVGWRNEVGIKYSDEFASGRDQPVLEGACLETASIGAADVFDLCEYTLEAVTLQSSGDDLARVVRGVVQHLNLQSLGRPVQVDGRLK